MIRTITEAKKEVKDKNEKKVYVGIDAPLKKRFISWVEGFFDQAYDGIGDFLENVNIDADNNKYSEDIYKDLQKILKTLHVTEK